MALWARQNRVLYVMCQSASGQGTQIEMALWHNKWIKKTSPVDISLAMPLIVSWMPSDNDSDSTHGHILDFSFLPRILAAVRPVERISNSQKRLTFSAVADYDVSFILEMPCPDDAHKIQ